MRLTSIINNIKILVQKILLNIIIFSIIGVQRSYAISVDTIEYIKEKISGI